MTYILAGVVCALVGFEIGFIGAMYLCWKQERLSTDEKIRRLLKK